MPKAKLKSDAPWKPSWWPDWKNEPLKFAFDPDAALCEVMKVKPPRDWRKVIKTGRRNRR